MASHKMIKRIKIVILYICWYILCSKCHFKRLFSSFTCDGFILFYVFIFTCVQFPTLHLSSIMSCLRLLHDIPKFVRFKFCFVW